MSDVLDESDLPWRVDLIDLATCSPAFRRVVEAQAVLLLELAGEAARRGQRVET